MASKKMKKKTRYLIEYLGTLLLIRLIRLLSLKRLLRFAEHLGIFAFSRLKIRRNTVMKNLGAAFPEKSEIELLDIAERTYQNFAKTALEFISFPKYPRDHLLSRCELVNRHYLDDLCQNKQGAVLVAGHFGNWELMGGALAMAGYPVHAVVADQHNHDVDRIMNRHREYMGIKIIHLGAALRGISKALRAHEFVALLSDQNARSQGVFVDFFGRPASTPQGPAVFALKTGCPIIFGSAIRLPNGKHRLEIELVTHDHLSGGATEENVKALTQLYTRKLEDKIREYPDHWFWMHRRWKSKPPCLKESKST